MIELEKIEFGNIRSFVGSQTIDFTNRDKLIQIDGRNENTGGSSGAGKSTVILVNDYILGLSDIPTTLLQSRATKDGLWAIGHYRFDGVPVKVMRSKKDGLVIETPTETVSGNVKMAEEKLEQLIGLPIKLFKKMIHKRQKEGGFFLNMSPKEMYDFLIVVLGLNGPVQQIESITEDINDKHSKISTTSKRIELDSASLIDLERILSEKKQPEINFSEEEIKQITESVSDLKGKISKLKEGLQASVDAIAKPELLEADTSEINAKIAALVPMRTEVTDKLKNIEQAQKTIQGDLGKIPFYIKEAQEIGAQIKTMKESKGHIEQSQCPTCMQTWVGDSAAEKVKNLENSIKESIDKVLSLKSQIDKKGELEEKLARVAEMKAGLDAKMVDLQDQRSKLDSEKFSAMEAVITENNARKDAYNKAVQALKDSSTEQLTTLNKYLSMSEVSLVTQESAKKSYDSTLGQYNKEVDSLKKLIETKRGDISKDSATLDALKKNVIVAEESKRLIKAYVLQTFQETLDSIGEVATGLLSAVPNTATSTIYFEGCKETKSGTIKDEIVAIINTDGTNDIPIKSYSGGERTTIDLAVDLAVIDVIETKAGKGANFIFMDEPFDGLDSVCKENCLEILKSIDTNKKIIMVDHSSELKEMVSDIILVVKKGETSTIAG